MFLLYTGGVSSQGKNKQNLKKGALYFLCDVSYHKL